VRHSEGAALRVAIIGASFAGLTLARALQQQQQQRPSSSAVRVVVLEARSAARFTASINGELDMHGLERGLLAELGLARLASALPRRRARPRNVQRRELLSGLAASLGEEGKGTAVRKGLCVREVSLSANGGLALALAENDDDDDDDDDAWQGQQRHDGGGGEPAPYGERRTAAAAGELECDVLVLACGLTALAAVRVPEDGAEKAEDGAEKSAHALAAVRVPEGGAAVARRVLLLGDAREHFGAEPLFGCRRLNYGASNAMRDGLSLARVLLAASAAGERDGAGAAAAVAAACAPYSVATWRAYRRRRRAVLLAGGLLLLLLLAAACRDG
jgi:hypothetical protein